MTPKTRLLVIVSTAFAACATAISVDYYLFKKPSFIKCKISPITELPTVESLLIKIEPESYLSRFSSHPNIRPSYWIDKQRFWVFGSPSAFLNDLNPLPQLSAGYAALNFGWDTGFDYQWGTSLVKNDPDSNHIKIPTNDGHVYTFNRLEVTVSRENGSYTEIIMDSRPGRNPRDKVTAYGTCGKAAEPPRKPIKQAL